jgi:glutathione S-transferase
MVMMRLFYSPGSCSLASHIALEEGGFNYSLQKIDVRAGENYSQSYSTINPWARVPALETAEGLLTENTAILPYLAGLIPDRHFLPSTDTFARARAAEWMGLMSSTIHVAFRMIFRPERFATTEAGRQDVTKTCLAALEVTLLRLDAQLQGRKFILGDRFSFCDAYLLVFALWTEAAGVRGRIASTPNLMTIAHRIAERPAVHKAMMDERLSFDATG